MDAWSGAIGLPLIGAALHPLLGVMVQRASRLGARLPVMLVKRCKEPLGARQLIGAILMVIALALVLI